MSKEYIVWGIQENGESEEPLYTLSRTMSEAEKVCELLEKDYKCRETRVQVLDLLNGITPSDFLG